MTSSLVGSEMCIRDRGRGACRIHYQEVLFCTRSTRPAQGHDRRRLVGSDIDRQPHELSLIHI
eukprot:8610458-Prorocentrum_lima.AAC.1